MARNGFSRVELHSVATFSGWPSRVIRHDGARRLLEQGSIIMQPNATRETFWDIGAAAERLSAFWDVSLVQTAPGALRLDFGLATVGRCSVYECSTNVELIATGIRADKVLTISPITSSCAASRFRGREIEPGHLLFMDPRGEVMQKIASGHHQVAISIPVDLFSRVAATESISEDRLDSFITWRTLLLSKGKLNLLHRMLSSILHGNFLGLEGPDADILLTQRIVEVIFDNHTRDAKIVSHNNRRRTVWDAIDLIQSRFPLAPSITEICEFTGVSRRSLFYAFDDLLGISPRVYINKVRFGAARQLIVQRLDQRCIQRVARELGFVHEGQFSIGYSSAFGESPTETRRRFISLRQAAMKPRETKRLR